MTVATAPATDEPLVAQPDRGSIFLSVREDLRLVKVPRYPRYGAGGAKVGEEPGQAVQFRDSRIFVPDDGDYELEDGRKIPAAELREWLLQHKRLGDPSDGFWMVETSAPAVSEAETRLVLENALDVEKLEAIIAQERAGWNRPALIGPVQDQIDKIRAMETEIRERAAAEAAAVKPAAKRAARAE